MACREGNLRFKKRHRIHCHPEIVGRNGSSALTNPGDKVQSAHLPLPVGTSSFKKWDFSSRHLKLDLRHLLYTRSHTQNGLVQLIAGTYTACARLVGSLSSPGCQLLTQNFPVTQPAADLKPAATEKVKVGHLFTLCPVVNSERGLTIQFSSHAVSAKTRNPNATIACSFRDPTIRRKTARAWSRNTKTAWPDMGSRYSTAGCRGHGRSIALGVC